MTPGVLSHETAMSRLSDAYVSALCAQIGCSVLPNRSDEDVEAVDLTLRRRGIDIAVQLKSTAAPAWRESGLYLPLKRSWVEAWRQRRSTPVYVIVLVVPESHDEWVRHPEKLTEIDGIAYWQRFDPETHVKSMYLPADQRLTGNALLDWFDRQSLVGFGEV